MRNYQETCGHPSCSGFTLLEMLAVVVVISLLAGLGWTAAAKGIQRSRESACTSNLRQISVAMQNFSIDNDNFFPSERVELPAVSSGSWPNYPFELSDYLPGYNKWGEPVSKTVRGVYWCPAARALHGISSGGSSYGLNACLSPGYTEVGKIKKTMISHPARTILMGDGFWITSGFASRITSWMLPATSNGKVTKKPYSHGNGIGNLLFCDGHVERWNDTTTLSEQKYRDLGPEDVWNPQKRE